MATPRRGGCSSLPFLLGLILFALVMGRNEDGRVIRDGTNPRRPEIVRIPDIDPGATPGHRGTPFEQPTVTIDDTAKPQDSQGTAFAIGQAGLWATAEHVVEGCDRIGLAAAPNTAIAVHNVTQFDGGDVAIIRDGLPALQTLPIARSMPRQEDDGYHMGFPSGQPAVVHGKLMGEVKAVRASGRSEPLLAWAEQRRMPEFAHALGGISGGPTLNGAGEVIGINSASSERRGRVLTTHPRALERLLARSGARADAAQPMPIGAPAIADARFKALVAQGVIRQVYCDVFEGR